MISIVAAVGKNSVIGFNGHLPWGKTMKNDIKRYSTLIAGQTIVMGANTFSEPDHARSKSEVVVLSRREMDLPENVRQVHSVEEVLELASSGDELIVTGGAMVFHLMIEYTDKIYLTLIDAEFEGDVFFPEVNKKAWKIVSREEYKKDDKNKYDYSFLTYERRR